MRLTVITGGGRGIGAATALRLAADSHDLVLGYVRDVGAAETTAERVRGLGVSCRPVRCDVTDEHDVDRLFDAAAELGQVTGVVNNAGSTLHLGDLVGAILVARRAVRDLTRGGAIVNVSSAAATLGSPHEYVHYAAAKAGVDALTHGLAQEVAACGIRVNGVAPGIVRTDIHAAAGDPGRLDRVAPNVPVGRVGEPEEVAEAVAWLLGDSCPYATGATLRVAGGR